MQRWPAMGTPTSTPTPTPPATPGPRRHHRARWVLGAIAVVLVVIVAAWFVFQRLSEPDPPSAFYTPPAELPAGPPGTIIRSQSIGSRVDGSEAWRVLYTSTAPDGSPIAVSGVVVAPPGAAPDNGWPVVAWAHGTTGVVPRCVPLLEEDGGLARVPALEELLAAGTVVAVTDYPGLGTPGIHPYLVGESEGRAVLDSIRAARGLLGAQVGDRAAVYGHSQGGHPRCSPTSSPPPTPRTCHWPAWPPWRLRPISPTCSAWTAPRRPASSSPRWP